MPFKNNFSFLFYILLLEQIASLVYLILQYARTSVLFSQATQ